MAHYVCPACGGESDQPKNCETSGCSLEGKPMVHQDHDGDYDHHEH